LIIIDGQEIEKYPVKYIRDQIAIVMQEPLLFNESIKNNIKYGNLEATDLQILEAAEQANCLDFIQKSEDQFQRKEVKSKIINEYDQIINTLSAQYPNISSLKILVNELLIEEIFLLKELLELVNNNAL
jgi:ABC-type multidrug transport system fused ATPase/permease subunit